ncbi:GlxA family transcriptional regulator [Chitinophaga japonensis]|uniref:Transcriptional regulator GlxA family with amidase domain n=1 Tax=Chitinophaga japonensis TaxID=104662 RepID=A0A562SSF6_CHIJA|nr:helix-turn-helix domain-containing protein [Chitinophaga japonensis]TWI84063.1 transcriptional regulator GlxA family with amidase domain [Chitinophaga japonensis]
MHFIIYLSEGFYAAIASTLAEILQVVNRINPAARLTYEFVSARTITRARSGIAFRTVKKPSRKPQVLFLLTGLGAEVPLLPAALEKEAQQALPWIMMAQKAGAKIAATCGAAFLLAKAGVLDGRKATVSWWLKKEVQQRFPQARWQPAKMVVRDGNIYTSGGGFSGLELIATLLTDLGFSEEEKAIRKLLVLPPLRQFQSPYEMDTAGAGSALEKKLDALLPDHLADMDVDFLAARLSLSHRTLSRHFFDELQTSPGKWIQKKRLEKAKALLEDTALTVAEICYQVGYDDPASFSRLFSRETGVSPVEFRKHLRGME